MKEKAIDKKTIQRYRIMRYFIEATHSIIENEGAETLTIRKVSDLAGYNSATLYNYFSSLDNLIAFSSLRYLKYYSDDLKNYVSPDMNSYCVYISIWKCFCKHAFQNPDIYHKIFFTELHSSIATSIQTYYKIFPDDLQDFEAAKFKSMLIGETIESRTIQLLQKPVQDGFFDEADIPAISEISILLFEGLLDRILSGYQKKSIDEAVETFVYHLQTALKPYLKKE